MEPDSEPQFAKRFPDCLRWKADRHEREDQLRELPSVLFAQLRHALLRVGHEEDILFSSFKIPEKRDLVEAWRNRPQLNPEALDVTEAKIEAWLKAYDHAWWWQEAPGLAQYLEVPSYVDACANLLEGRAHRTSVPIVALDGENAGRVQMLHFDRLSNYDEAALYMHPESEFARSCFSAEFLSSIETVWQLADGESSKPVTVFWQITETDGKPIISEQQSGTSASAAAFRAFWHIRRGLSLDPEVYVLGSCASADGSVQDVGGLAQKIGAVREHRQAFGIQTPGTLVMSAKPSYRTQHDITAIAQSEAWAVVHQVSTLADLSAVRSCESAAASAYLRHLADSLDQCRLLPRGKRLSEVHVPSQVWKDERIRSEHEADWPEELEADAVNSPEERDSLPKKRRVRQPWERVFQMHRGRSPLVLVGGPGCGKSTVLHWTALEMARDAAAMLDARTASCAKVSWPVLLNLDTWAAHEPRKQPRPSLVSLITGSVPQDQPRLELEAVTRLIEQRLTGSVAHTWLFLDSLDQVAAARGPLLARRLTALNDLTTRLVLTTRESGLHTHDETMKTLPNPTIVQSAPLTPQDARTLAAKWLGPEQAARLERHLRSHPSLGIVADSPLLLTLACFVASENGRQTLPETPAELYQAMLLLLAQGRWRSTDDAPPVCDDPQALLDQLPAIAWRLFVRNPGVNRFDRATMVDAIQQAAGIKGKAATEFLDQQLVELGFVEAAEAAGPGQHYQFRHTTLLEFLAGKHLATAIHLQSWASALVDSWQASTGWQSAKAADIIDAQAFEPSWEPVVLFTAGQMQEPLPLIEMLADRKKDDLYRHRLALLCRCCESIAAQKEGQLRDLLRSVLKQMAQIGHRAVRKRPERWKRWLENIGALLSLPQTSQEAVQLLVSLVSGRHEGRMHGNHDILELLVAKASSANPVAALDAMLKLCTEDMEGHPRDRMATALVECAEKNGAHGHVEKLEMQVNDLGDKPGQQIAICGGLLASGDSSVVDRAIEFLKTKAQDWEAEEWVRSSAAHQLINSVGRGQELTVATILIDKIFKSYSYGAGDTASHSFAYEVVSTVLRRPSEFGIALSLLIFKTHTHAAHLLFRCCEVLAKTQDPGLQQIGLKFLREQLGHPDRIGSTGDHVCNTAAAKLLNELGGEEGRAKSVEYLWAATALPVMRGWCHHEAVEALLEIGVPYDRRMHDLIERCCQSDLMEDGVLAMMASIARSNDDNKILELVAPRLNQVIADAKSVHEPKKPGSFERDRSAKALVGTIHGKPLVAAAFGKLFSGVRENSETDWFDVSTIALGALSSEIIELLPVLLQEGKMDFRPWHRLLRELTKRGWRLRLRGRKIEVLRRGQEDPRADADFGC